MYRAPSSQGRIALCSSSGNFAWNDDETEVSEAGHGVIDGGGEVVANVETRRVAELDVPREKD